MRTTHKTQYVNLSAIRSGAVSTQSADFSRPIDSGGPIDATRRRFSPSSARGSRRLGTERPALRSHRLSDHENSPRRSTEPNRAPSRSRHRGARAVGRVARTRTPALAWPVARTARFRASPLVCAAHECAHRSSNRREERKSPFEPAYSRLSTMCVRCSNRSKRSSAHARTSSSTSNRNSTLTRLSPSVVPSWTPSAAAPT